MLKQWIIGCEQPSKKKLFLWNLLGSGLYSLASLILIYLTIYIIGPMDGGIFSISLTLAQMYVYIVYYETRNYMVTDTINEFPFIDYYVVKIVNAAFMILISFIYALCKNFAFYKLLIFILVSIYRLLDGYADVFEGYFHKVGRLDLAGKSMFFRTLISVLLYFFVLKLTNNLIYALITAIFSGIVALYFFDILIFDLDLKIKGIFNKNNIIAIWKQCFPLFIGMFLWTYILSASRIAVDDVMSSNYQSYYQLLFLPVSVINLFAGFLIRPSLLKLTTFYKQKNLFEFKKIIFHILAYLLIFTIFCLVLAYTIGIHILGVFAGCSLIQYRNLFVFLIFAGCFNAIAYLLYYVLTIYRERKGIMYGYGVATVCSILISRNFVVNWGMWGAALSYFISIVLLVFVFIICIHKSEINMYIRKCG